jgi:hypothetical protein
MRSGGRLAGIRQWSGHASMHDYMLLTLCVGVRAMGKGVVGHVADVL